jgi:RNA-binding protein YhbY
MQQLGTGARIGKGGLTQGVIDEIKKQLRVKGAVKIKLLRSFIMSNEGKRKKELFQEIADMTGGRIESAVGFVLVLSNPNHKRKVI